MERAQTRREIKLHASEPCEARTCAGAGAVALEQLSELRVRRRGYCEDQPVAEGGDESSRRSLNAEEGESIECPTLSQNARKDGPPAGGYNAFGGIFNASAVVGARQQDCVNSFHDTSVGKFVQLGSMVAMSPLDPRWKNNWAK